jgi:hypothetical protein
MAMVDFGFGRFLEMFEERFGRLPTTILVATAGLGIFAVCASQVYEHIVFPLYYFVAQILSIPGWTISLIPALISGIVTGSLLGSAIYIYDIHIQQMAAV